MSKSGADFRSWVYSLDAAIEADGRIRAWCTKCREYRDIDLVALREKVGGQYSLLNRRCRCRITEGCDGWNRFDYLLGVFRPLRDQETWERWIRSDWEERIGKVDGGER